MFSTWRPAGTRSRTGAKLRMPVDAGQDELVRDGLGLDGRDGDDADADALARDDGRHLVDRVAAAAVEDAAGLLGGRSKAAANRIGCRPA